MFKMPKCYQKNNFSLREDFWKTLNSLIINGDQNWAGDFKEVCDQFEKKWEIGR